MAEDHAILVVMDPARGDEASTLELHGRPHAPDASRRDRKALGVVVEGLSRVGDQNAVSLPSFKVACRPAIGVVLFRVAGFSFAEDDTYQVIRAGGVILVLHLWRDLVVGLGHHV